MDFIQARLKIEQLKNKPKYETMLITASILTGLLEKYNIKPVIVGGFSVEIYTQQEYATRDIDFVSDGYDIIAKVLLSLGFIKEGRHFYHEEIEVAIEVPDNYLAGDYDKILKVVIDNEQYVYLISVEDIILDRLRGGVHFKSEDDLLWSFKLLSSNYTTVDIEYLKEKTETKSELEVLEEWLVQLEKGSDSAGH